VPEQDAGAAFAFVNMLIIAVGAVLQPLIAILADMQGRRSPTGLRSAFCCERRVSALSCWRL
jgi:hypothetical protein